MFSNRFIRVLDPSQDVYWLSSYACEYMYNQTLAGFGYRPTGACEVIFIMNTFMNIYV